MRLKSTYIIFILVLAFACIWGCIDDPEFSSDRHNVEKPAVAKLEIIKKDITATSVALKSEILKANGYPIVERGFAWSTDPDSSKIPSNQFQKFDDKGVVGQYVDTIKNLLPGGSYYFWAYAKNEKGNYGFSIGDTVSTSDGKGRLKIIKRNARGKSAVISSVIERYGEGEIESYGIYFSELRNLSNRDSVESKIHLKSDTFTCKMMELKTNTLYYLKTFVKTSLNVRFESTLDSVHTTQGTPQVDSIISWSIDKDNVLTPLSLIIDEGDDEISDRGFCWSDVNSEPKKKDACDVCDDKSSGIGGGLGNSYFVTNIENLKPNKKYYLRAYATNGYGTEYGKVAVVETNSDVPIVETREPENHPVKGTLLFGGRLVSEGRTTVVEYGICYSDTYFDTAEELYKNGTIEPISSFTGNVFSDYFSGLKGATTYYVCAYAKNEDGTGYGVIRKITTTNIFTTSGAVFPGKTPLAASAAYFMIGNNAYLLGGDVGNEYTDKLYIYDTERYEWKERKPFLGGLSKWQTAVEYNNSAYVFGGLDKNETPRNDFYHYILPPENKWELIPSASVDAAYQQVGLSLGSAIYFIGGRADTTMNIVWAYDFISNSWIRKADFEVEQYGGIGLVINDIAYVGLGKDNTGNCNYTIWKSSDMNSWTVETTNLSIKGGVLVSTVHKDKIYVVDEDFRIHVYDPVVKEWKMKSIIPDVDSGQGLHCMYSIDEFIYIGLINGSLYKYAPLWDN